MGQAALKHEAEDLEDGSATVIHLKPPQASEQPARATERNEPPASLSKTELPSLLGIISRASTLLTAQRDRSDSMEKRALTAEELLKAANRRLADVEIKLKAVTEDLKAERARAADVQKRSNEVVEKTRSMLNEASERLRAAEARAERAETSFSTVRGALEQQLAGLIK